MNHLMIKDLESSKALDARAMQEVSGGSDLNSFSAQLLSAETKAGIAAITTATQTLVDVNTLLDVNVSPVTNINIGGIS